jgi:hypothetical protein
LRIVVGIYRNVKAIFTKKQDTAAVLKDLITGMKEAKDSVIRKVKRVKKAPAEIKKVEMIEEEEEENRQEKQTKKSKKKSKRK